MRDDPPQTPLEAIEQGWTWLSATCSCKRRGSVKFSDLTIADGQQPLAALARKMRCRQCRSRDGIRFSLGGYTFTDSRPAERLKHVAFDGDQTVRAPRS